LRGWKARSETNSKAFILNHIKILKKVLEESQVILKVNKSPDNEFMNSETYACHYNSEVILPSFWNTGNYVKGPSTKRLCYITNVQCVYWSNTTIIIGRM